MRLLVCDEDDDDGGQERIAKRMWAKSVKRVICETIKTLRGILTGACQRCIAFRRGIYPHIGL